MKTRFYIFLLASCVGFANCSVTKNYNADKKYPKEKLQEDYTLLRNILEKKHPSLYWYTPKDSMNKFFDEGYQNIKDSMTELQFGWKVLAPITNKIHCGHTSFSMSKGWNKFIKNKISEFFSNKQGYPVIIKEVKIINTKCYDNRHTQENISTPAQALFPVS